jgi:hypothetical protein
VLRGKDFIDARNVERVCREDGERRDFTEFERRCNFGRV